ncbi:tctex1 domain-containing protein 1-B-like [Acanthaster planci]|uniref:Tctex1 domain-containing protein 1-B-like n=1 Tax=Acanthaster planci TaxID=133434 RepID=A0A8B7Y858_ACAPL|nr:tctex1 domain-containing protein 1-B-like [Acanthaster planci]
MNDHGSYPSNQRITKWTHSLKTCSDLNFRKSVNGPQYRFVFNSKYSWTLQTTRRIVSIRKMSLLKLIKAAQNKEAPASEEAGANGSVPPAGDAASTSEQSDNQAPSIKTLGRKMSVWSTVARKLSVSTTASTKTTVNKPAVTLPKKRFENSYRTEPDASTSFNGPKVEKFLWELLEMRLKSERYDPRTCSSLTTSLADVIKARMKKMGFTRHRIVVYVIVGEKRDQGMQACGRCVWDAKTDNFVTVTYENSSLFVVVSVYGIYYE